MKYVISLFLFLITGFTAFSQCDAPTLESWHFTNPGNLEIDFTAPASAQNYAITFYALYTGSGTMPGTASHTFTGNVESGINHIEVNPTVTLDFTVSHNRYFYKVELSTTCAGNVESDIISFYASPYSMKNNPGFSCGENSFSPMALLPDNGGDPYEYSFEIAEGAGPDVISNIGVLVDIGHLFNGDLSVSLISPAGTEVFLIDYPNMLSNTSGLSMYFSTEGQEQSFENQYGIFQPAQSLSAFEGESAVGTWKLSLIDNSITKYGLLYGVCLNFGDLPCMSSVSGLAYFDLNGNNVKDSNEPVFPYAHFHEATTNTDFYSGADGKFYGCMPDINNNLQLVNKPKYHTINPNPIALNHLQGGYKQGFNIAVAPEPGTVDLELKMWQVEPVIAGQPGEFSVAYTNVGTTCIEGGEFEINLPEALTITNIDMDDVTLSGNTATFSTSANICPHESFKFIISFDADNALNTGDVLISQAAINAPFEEGFSEYYENNTSIVQSVVVDNPDLNFKSVSQDTINSWFLTSEQYLDYVIHFQNMSGDAIHSLVITDDMDLNLDLFSFKVLETSHPMKIEQTGNAFNFTFEDIDLVSSNADEYASRGFIRYSLQPASNIQVGAIIENTATLFPDDIPEIELNTVTTLYIAITGLTEIELKANVFPNPTSQYLEIIAPANVELRWIEIYDLNGKKIAKYSGQNVHELKVDVSTYAKGAYILKFVGNKSIKPVAWIKD